MNAAYASRKGNDECLFCNHTAIDVGGWKIIPNDYPYDEIASEQLMIFPTRHLNSIFELNDYEQRRLAEIYKNVDIEGFDAVMMNFPGNQSIKGHLHLHLLKFKVREV